jgi:hypothetical protein
MSLDATPLNVDTLPVLLAGPILRRLTRTSVSVWAALSVADNVTLHVQQLNQPATEQTTAATPVRVGQNLWLAVLTLQVGNFQAGQIYEYWLTSPNWPASRSPTWPQFGYRGATRPTFPGLPAALDQLQVLHISCRKPHGGMRDGLEQVHLILNDAGEDRPHLLLLSGDQIYADDVASVLTPRIRRVAADLINIDEGAVFGPATPIAGRQAVCDAVGLTTGAGKDHLLGLGEYYAMYLLTWSEALWPANLPVLTDADPGEVQLQIGGEANPQLDAETWDNESSRLALFRGALPLVRRALANIPTLMIWDDHEVTDDWNLDYNWCRGVYTRNQGARVVTNGMLAYLLFQHWGNEPERFVQAGTPEQQALAAATWNNGTHPAVNDANLPSLLGVPSTATIPASFPTNGITLRQLTDPTSLRYDFTLDPDDGYPLRLVALDGRSARFFAEDDKPPARIGPATMDVMWPAPVGNAADTPTLLITPAPVLGLHVLEHMIQPAYALTDKGETAADFEPWSAYGPAFEHLLDRINAYRRVVILSGDVHYGYTKTLSYEKPVGMATGAAVQFVNSAAKNATGQTIALHLAGDLGQQIGLIRTRTFFGYQALTPAQRALLDSPPANAVLPYDDMVDVLLGRELRKGLETPAVFSQEVAQAYNLGAPDWQYTIEHIYDETPVPPGNLKDAMDLAITNSTWDGWDRSNSIDMVRALRASDLHLIGRVLVGLPQLGRITFSTAAGLVARQELFHFIGDQAAGLVRTTTTEANLG